MKIWRSIASLLLAGILVFSSAGFSVNRHFCKGDLVKVSFYGSPHQCDKEVKSHCEKSGDHCRKKQQKSNCCDNESLTFDGVEVESPVRDILKLDLPQPSLAPLSNFHSAFARLNDLCETVNNHPPPLIQSGRQILVMVQRFLL